MSESSDPEERDPSLLIFLNIIVGLVATVWAMMLGLAGDGCGEVIRNADCNFPLFMFFFWVGILFPTVAVVVAWVLRYTVLKGRRSGRLVVALCSPFVIVTTALLTFVTLFSAGMRPYWL